MSINKLDRIRVLDAISSTVLKEFSSDSYEEAQIYASEMEKMGLDIILDAPSLPESLAINLGANTEDVGALKDIINEEIDSHNDCPCQ